MKTQITKSLADAHRAVALLKSSRPGCADMETRKTRRAEACALLADFLAIEDYGKHRKAASEIMDELCEI